MLDLRKTKIKTIPTLCSADPEKLSIDIRETDVDLCHCDNLWLKHAQGKGALVNVDYIQCHEESWTALSLLKLSRICHKGGGQ